MVSSRAAGGGHGDLYPLSPAWRVEAPPKPGLSGGTRQRVQLRRAKAFCALETVEALNHLSEGGDVRRPRRTVCAPLLPVQAEALAEVWEAASETPATGVEFRPEEALRTLLQAEAGYGSSSAGSLAQYSQGEVSLPDGQKEAVVLSDVLDGDAKRCLDDGSERMLLTAEEREGHIEREGLPGTYHDPVLENDRKNVPVVS